ncbi:unnamed protein product [Polarella glacialis]|nr:unnamed protein product [Polarella glacialis]
MFKLAVAAELEAFGASGKVESSLDIADQFIHLSDVGAPPTVAKLFFSGATDLQLLEIDESKLTGPVNWVVGKMGDAPPDAETVSKSPLTIHYMLPDGCVHVYGSAGVPMSAVIKQAPVPLGADGVHVFPEWLTN